MKFLVFSLFATILNLSVSAEAKPWQYGRDDFRMAPHSASAATEKAFRLAEKVKTNNPTYARHYTGISDEGASCKLNIRWSNVREGVAFFRGKVTIGNDWSREAVLWGTRGMTADGQSYVISGKEDRAQLLSYTVYEVRFDATTDEPTEIHENVVYDQFSALAGRQSTTRICYLKTSNAE